MVKSTEYFINLEIGLNYLSFKNALFSSVYFAINILFYLPLGFQFNGINKCPVHSLNR